MSLYGLFVNGELDKNVSGINVDTSKVSKVGDIQNFLDILQNKVDILYNYNIDDLLMFFNNLSKLWQSKSHAIQKHRYLGLNFLIHWLKFENLSNICDISIKKNRYFLDNFCKINNSDKILLRAHSKGIVGHWIAGNIPILGMISLVQGILTKNLNVVRVSQSFGNVLPEMLNTFREIEFENKNGKLISGAEIAKTVNVIYYDKANKEVGNTLSRNLDVRVVWGGQEAVEAIIGLEKSIDTVDIIFGPKYSFAVVDNSFLNSEKSVKTIAQKLAFDISSFEQKGCNSPHTLFVEKGGKIDIETFCDFIGEGLEKVLRLIPKEKIDSNTVTKILNVRSEYGFTGKVVCSKGMEWTVLFSKDENGIAEPCFGRTVFVRQVDDIYDVIKFTNHSHQSVGLAIKANRKFDFAEELTKNGIARCPDIGSMSLYEVPWDGVFPIERMVRWAYLYES